MEKGLGREKKEREEIKIYLREDDKKGWRRYLGGEPSSCTLQGTAWKVKRIYWRELCNGMMAWSTERAWEENIVCGFNWLEWGGGEMK